jgi:hypothetical protein
MDRAVVVAAALTALVTTGAAQSQTALFESAAPVTVGPGPGQILLIDLNRDGHLDLVTAHLLTRVIGVQLGTGRGRFTPASTSPMTLGFAPGAIAAGDVNGDGVVDLVLASRDESREYIHIFAGDGRGGFASASRHVIAQAIAYYKPRIVLADADANGAVDIVYANGRRNSVELLLGLGRGTFRAGETVTLQPRRDFYTFVLGDIDLDGHVDLIAAGDADSGGEHLEIRRGIGGGTFATASEGGPTLPRPRVAALADLDGDRLPDLVVAHAEDSRLSVMSNAGGGRFVHASTSPHSIPTEAFAILVHDVDGDRHPDIVAATVNSRARPYDSSVTVLLGSPREPAVGSPFRVAPGSYQLAAGDINEDGKVDLVASSFEGETVSILLGR